MEPGAVNKFKAAPVVTGNLFRAFCYPRCPSSNTRQDDIELCESVFTQPLVIGLVRASAGQGGVLDRWDITHGQDEDWKAGNPVAHTTPKNMATAGRLSGLLIQALRHLGKEHIRPTRMEHLKRTLPARERKKLLPDLLLAPAWMHTLFRELARN